MPCDDSPPTEKTAIFVSAGFVATSPPTYPTLNAKQKKKPPEPDADATNETAAAKTTLNAPKTKNFSPRPCFSKNRRAFSFVIFSPFWL